MKNLSFLTMGVVFLLFASCDKIKEATTVEIETDLKVDVPIITTGTANATKSAEAGINAYTFGGSKTFSLTENDDIETYINNIDDIIADGLASIQITGVPVGGTINTCVLKYGVSPTAGTTAFTLSTPINAVNGTITITDVAWVNTLLGILKQNKTAVYKIDISGTASFDVNHVVKINIPVLIKANPL